MRGAGILLLVILASMLAPASMLASGTASDQKPLVVAWIYKVTPEVYRVVRENHEYISWLSPDWFVLKDNGTIGEFTERGANDLNLINLASEYGIQIHPMVVSNVPERMHQLFTDPKAFNNFANTLIELAKTYGYNGFNIDFEAPMLEDAQAFAQFLSMLAYRLHKAGLKLTVAVAAKRMDYSTNSFLGAFDYKALGQSGVDYIMIMAYDYYELKGAPRPVAPPDWVEACVRYALVHIPRKKLLLGIPSYGWEWTKDGKLVDWHMYDYITSLIERQGLKPVFDETYKEKYLDLGSTVIYYNDHETVVYKARIARKYDLPGVAVWRLDGGDPLIWEAIYRVLTETTTTTSTQTTQPTATTTTTSPAPTTTATTTTTTTTTQTTTTTSQVTTTTTRTTTTTTTTTTTSPTTTTTQTTTTTATKTTTTQTTQPTTTTTTRTTTTQTTTTASMPTTRTTSTWTTTSSATPTSTSPTALPIGGSSAKLYIAVVIVIIALAAAIAVAMRR